MSLKDITTLIAKCANLAHSQTFSTHYNNFEVSRAYERRGHMQQLASKNCKWAVEKYSNI